MTRGDSAPSPVVVKVGGALLDDASSLRTFLSHAAKAAGRLVLVHGGGGATDRLLSQLGIDTPRIEGLRATPDEAIDVVVGSLAGTANHRLVAGLHASGARAVGLSLTSGGLCRCERARAESGDLGRVGLAHAGDRDLVRLLLEAGFVPVVSSIGDDGAGGALNVNADDAAVAVAATLGAREIVLLTDVAGVRGGDGHTMAELDEAETDRLIETGVIAGGMIPKVRGALRASAALGRGVRIGSWNDAGWLDLLTTRSSADAAFGTLVTARVHPIAAGDR